MPDLQQEKTELVKSIPLAQPVSEHDQSKSAPNHQKGVGTYSEPFLGDNCTFTT